uniref:VirD4-like conjugal transfer protein, CD1115 family n=1 Tax=Eubacterium sp. TaxID=142586 RepID=UPI0040261E0E
MKTNKTKPNKNHNANRRILAKGCYISNNTWATGLNNNDIIIGPSGSGKTRGYVKPNILQCNESMIIADTKGNLIKELKKPLEKAGYRVIDMNFKNLAHSYGYNPFDYIRYDKESGRYNEQDILTIASAIVPKPASKNDPFWELAAKMYFTSAVAYTMECLPEDEHNLDSAITLSLQMGSGNYAKLIEELECVNPDSLAARTYNLFKSTYKSEKTEASILAILGEKFNGLILSELLKMYKSENRIDFSSLGREKTAVFLSISDTDRSKDRIISLFYTQALQALCNSADFDYEDCRLPVPVRFILDDFATNAYIPDFDKIISVIRSREIYVSIILQSITQLDALYGASNAKTIINNCDNCLYLGGQDIDTANYMSFKANKSITTILNMPLDEAYLFTRGREPRIVEKYDITEHTRYRELPESRNITVENKNMEGCEICGI